MEYKINALIGNIDDKSIRGNPFVMLVYLTLKNPQTCGCIRNGVCEHTEKELTGSAIIITRSSRV